MASPTVFYAWQSDRPEDVNRYFIKAALEDAVKSMANDPAIEDAPRLDHDTKGLTGTPDIFQAILRKIESCSAFVADLTFVGKKSVDSQPAVDELIPNANVLLELGYAMHCVGWERVICVMNTAFGDPSELPFDLRARRWPIQFKLTSRNDPNYEKTRNKLASDLRTAIRFVLASGLPAAGVAVAVGASVEFNARFKKERDAFESAVVEGNFHGVIAEKGILTLFLSPEVPLAKTVDFRDPKVRQCQLLALGHADWVPVEVHAKYLFCIQRYADGDAPHGAVELREDGSIRAADGYLLDGGYHPDQARPKHQKEMGGTIPSGIFEPRIVRATASYVRLARSLDIAGPMRCAISLFHIRGYAMAVDSWAWRLGHGIRVFGDDSIIPDAVTIPADEAGSSEIGIALALKPMFDHIWLEFGYEGSLSYGEQGVWKI
jgi:hypothetical protein